MNTVYHNPPIKRIGAERLFLIDIMPKIVKADATAIKAETSLPMLQESLNEGARDR